MEEARILEAGHYYQAKGPTLWSVVGWRILEQLRQLDDKTMLFIDDFHELKDLDETERDALVVDFAPNPDYIAYEASLVPDAERVFQMLMELPPRRRPKQKEDGSWKLNGTIKLKYPSGKFTCVMLDAGLCLKKSEIAGEAVNIVPYYYESEQKNLLAILRKAMPDFSLQVVLFELNGEFRMLVD